MIYKIDHVGIAVDNLESALKLYNEGLNLECTGLETIENQGVKVAFIPLGESEIELLEATNDESPIKKFIGKKGEGIHHIAFRVDSIEDTMENLKSSGLVFINEKPTYGAGGAKIAFLHPKSTGGVLIELCEREV